MPTSPRTDLVVSATAIFISLCTLVVLLYEARIMREQQRAAVWPYVEVGMGFGSRGLAVRTSNNGIGPARIRAMEVRVDGEPVQTWVEMLDSLGVSYTDYSEDRTNGRVLPGQTALASLQIRSDTSLAVVQDAYLAGERLVFELCYCSVYDDCWQVEVRGLDETRKRVDACESRPDVAFQR